MKEIIYDLDDPTLFGNEAAEDEEQSLFLSYYVESEELRQFTHPGTRIQIVRAYKGEGKSAMLRQTAIEIKSRDPQALTVTLKPSTMAARINAGNNYEAWIRGWKEAIISEVASSIGASIGFAGSDDAITLVEHAEAHGFRPRTFVGTVLDRLKAKGLPVEQKKLEPADLEQSILRLRTKPNIWVFADDADLNFQNTPEQRLKVAGLLTAIRQLSQTIPELTCRLGIRPNVWTILAMNVEDMTHVRQYIVDLRWDVGDLRRLLAKRLRSYITRTNQLSRLGQSGDTTAPDEHLIGSLFNAPWSWGYSEHEPIEKAPHVVLATLCRARPRWLVELCREAASVAHARGGAQITQQDVLTCMPSFGRRRLQDTVVEFRSQCPEIEAILHAFAEQKELYATDDLLATIRNRITNLMSVSIAGVVGKATPRDVAELLFQIGVISARSEDQDGRYKHFSFSQKPQLWKNTSNLDEGHRWEIHPVFREALHLRNVRRITRGYEGKRHGREGRD